MAPLALLVALAAVGYVVSSGTREDEPSSSGGSSSSKESSGEGTSTGGRTTTSEGGKTTTTSSEPKSYTVKSGDTLGMISEETGVPIAELQELNPDLDPQSLTVGDRIRLRR
jgi:LysM repeat protein